MKRRALCWRYFTLITKDGRELAKCNVCDEEYSYHKNTTNLNLHLNEAHPALKNAMLPSGGKKRKILNDSDYESNDECSSAASLSDDDIELNCPEKKKFKKFDELLLNFIINTNQPLSLVDSEDFRKLIGFLNKHVSLPCRQTFTNYVDIYYNKVKNQIIFELKKIDYVCITTDIWSSQKNESYIGVTAHFINEDFVLIKRTLALRYLEESHTADNIHNCLLNIFIEWGIENKVRSLSIKQKIISFSYNKLNLTATASNSFNFLSKVTHIVTDGAANMLCAITKFQSIQHVPCTAHKLNLCVLDIFKEKRVDDRDKNTVKQTNLYNANVKSLEKIINKCRSIVGSFRHSGRLTDTLKRAQIEMNMKQLKLVQDVKTRWNTTVDLMISLVTNFAPISALAADPSNATIKRNLPDEVELSIIYDLIHLLEPVKDLTVSLSGHNYCTISSLLPLVHFLVFQEVSPLAMGENRSEQARNCLYESLNSRFQFLLEDQLDLFLAITLLDSNYKCFDFLNDHELKQEYQARAKSYLIALFYEWFTSGNQSTTSPVDTSTPTTTSKTQKAQEKPKLLKKIQDKQTRFNSFTFNDSPSPPLSAEFEIELECYLRDVMTDENPLVFFKTYQRKYPLLSQIVKRLFHITATSVPSESLFSQTGLIDTELRNRLSYSHLEKLIFLKENSF